MLKYYDFSGGSFLVDKSFECENASENAAARFDPAVRLYTVPGYCTVLYCTVLYIIQYPVLYCTVQYRREAPWNS